VTTSRYTLIRLSDRSGRQRWSMGGNATGVQPTPVLTLRSYRHQVHQVIPSREMLETASHLMLYAAARQSADLA
jgi:hypothetical protein